MILTRAARSVTGTDVDHLVFYFKGLIIKHIECCVWEEWNCELCLYEIQINEMVIFL